MGREGNQQNVIAHAPTRIGKRVLYMLSGQEGLDPSICYRCPWYDRTLGESPSGVGVLSGGEEKYTEGICTGFDERRKTLWLSNSNPTTRRLVREEATCDLQFEPEK